MKNMFKYILAFAVVGVMTFTGCIKETMPMGSTATQDQVSSSPSGLAALVSSLNAQMTVYDTLGNEAHYDFGYPTFLIIWDLLGNDMATFTTSYHQYRNWEQNQYMGYDYAAARMFWTWYYKMIFICNSVIGTTDDPTNEGIALAYRAMCYLDLARLYDFKENNYTDGTAVKDLAVPIVTEETDAGAVSNNPRAATADVYALVESDLLRAEECLANYTRQATNTPDQTVVWGLLARMYLEKGARFNDQQAYASAAKYARKVIDCGKYSPVTEAQWHNPTTGFNSSTATNAWMWSVNTTKEDRVVTTGICNFPSMISAECSYGYALAVGKSSPMKCVDAAFYASIPDSDWRKKTWLAPDYSNADMAILGEAWTRKNLNPYCQFKFRPGNGNGSVYLEGSSVDIPLMRIEEMYLIEAEATGLANGEAAGRTLLENFVTSYRDAEFEYNTRIGISNNVLQQKRIEFWGEGITFFDFKRLGKGVNRGYEGTNHYDATRFNTNGLAPWYNFCININETNSNDAIPAELSNPDPSGTVPLWE